MMSSENRKRNNLSDQANERRDEDAQRVRISKIQRQTSHDFALASENRLMLH